MPDLLAHALLTYALATALSWRVAWLDRRYVTVAVVGAFVPDLTKIWLLLPGGVVQSVVGIPWSWGALGTGGGAALSVLVGVILARGDQRRRVAGLLALGAVFHLLADSMLLTPSGHSKQVFWPLLQYRVPTPGLYLSTQAWPTVAAVAVAGVTWVIDWRPATTEDG